MVHEHRRVECPDLPQGAGAVERPGAAGVGDRGDVERAVGLTVAADEAHAQVVQLVAARVQHRSPARLAPQELGLHGARLRVRLGHVDQRAEEVRLQGRVLGHDDDVVGAVRQRRVHGQRVAAGVAQVLAGHDHADAGRPLVEPARRAPVGTVVDDDELPALARVALGLQARPQRVEVLRAVKRDEDDGDRRRRHVR